MALDPIDYAVISQSLQAAAREMGVKLIKSAYSTILREARDGSAAVDGGADLAARARPPRRPRPGHVTDVGRTHR